MKYLKKYVSAGCAALALVAFGHVHAENSAWDPVANAPSAGLMQIITVYRSATCGCCKGWVSHLKKNGFHVNDIEVSDIDAIKRQHGIPEKMASCHTAMVGGYLIEGHVPANDIRRILKDRPPVAGLAVPGMPTGTPGMEMGGRKDPFQVIAFGKQGETKLFNEYSNY